MKLASKVIVSCALAGVAIAGSYAASFAPMQPKEVIAKYGKPDKVQSAEFERPRPPMVTQTLEYKKANARVLLLADAPMGSPPPYARWLLMGYQDSATGRKISASEFESRLNAKKP